MKENATIRSRISSRGGRNPRQKKKLRALCILIHAMGK